MQGPSRGMSFVMRHPATNIDRLDAPVGQVTPVNVLSDDVLLVIFDFYVGISPGEEAWQSLVHVCRRWRCLVFESSRRLNLRLVCTPGTPVRESLNVWPALPLIVTGVISLTSADNTVAALGHRDGVCRIDFRMPAIPRFRRDESRYKVLEAMQVPFPALTHLELWCPGEPGQSFPVPSWVDLPHVCNISGWTASRFPEYQI